MKHLLTIIFLLPLFAMAQNPISITYLKPGGTPALYSTPDTVIVSVKGTSGFWSTTVKLAATTTVRPYKAPVIVPPADLAPTVNLGFDLTYTLSVGETSRIVALSATVSDENPSTVSYLWTGTGVSASAKTQNISLAAGAYTYTLKVTDAGGKSATDNLTIIINPAPVTPPPTGVQPTVYSSFDNATPKVKTMMKNDIGEPWEMFQSANDAQITISRDIKFKGTGALRIKLNRTDPYVSSKVRAEMTQGAVDSQQNKLMTGENTPRPEEWIGLAVYQENFAADNHPFSWLQWHQEENTASPDAATWQRAGYLEILRTTSPNLNGGWEQNPSRAGWYVRPTPNATFPQNRWVTVVIHIKWSSTNTGVWEMWQDGVKVYDRQNVVTSYAGQRHYLKLGLYCWKWPDNQDCFGVGVCDPRVIYYDEVRRYFGSNGYDIVNPIR